MNVGVIIRILYKSSSLFTRNGAIVQLQLYNAWSTEST